MDITSAKVLTRESGRLMLESNGLLDYKSKYETVCTIIHNYGPGVMMLMMTILIMLYECGVEEILLLFVYEEITLSGATISAQRRDEANLLYIIFWCNNYKAPVIFPITSYLSHNS